MLPNSMGIASGAHTVRVLLVDSHRVFRAACRALLLTQGLDVVADLFPCDQAVAVAADLDVDVALIDVTPGEPGGLDVARRLIGLRDGPLVVLISSSEIVPLATELGAGAYLSKADVCAEAIADLQRASRSRQARR